MNLEYLNNEYNSLKTSLEAEKQAYERMKTRAQSLQGEQLIWSATKENEQRAGNAAGVANAKAQLTRIKGEMKTLRKNALIKKELINHLQADIGAKFAQIESDPSLKQHLDQVIVKKYDRQLTKLEKEKKDKEKENEKLDFKKDKLATLKNLVTSHKTVKNNLIGFLKAKKNLDDLNNELNGLRGVGAGGVISYTDPARANDIINNLIPAAQTKITTNKGLLMGYITRKGYTIKEADIEELYSNGAVINSRGEVNIDATFNNSIVSIDKKINQNRKQIKGIDKRIQDNTSVLGKHGATHTPVGAPAPATPPPPPPPQPKWWQFGKRFQNWNERRKQGRLPVTTTPTAPTPTSAINTKAFKDSMKYDIVKDLVEKTQKDERKVAKQERITSGDGR